MDVHALAGNLAARRSRVWTAAPSTVARSALTRPSSARTAVAVAAAAAARTNREGDGNHGPVISDNYFADRFRSKRSLRYGYSLVIGLPSRFVTSSPARRSARSAAPLSPPAFEGTETNGTTWTRRTEHAGTTRGTRVARSSSPSRASSLRSSPAVTLDLACGP